MADTQNIQVAIPLPEKKRKFVQAGCICMMLSVAMYGLVFATLTSPILESVNAMGYVGLFSIFSALGLSIMTPIGGKLGDLIGRRNIVVIPGIICAVCGIAFAFVRSLVPLMILRFLISLAQGAFTAAPYIITGLINERKKGLCQTAVFPVWTQSPGLELLGLIYKRLAVCTFLLGWVHFMSSDLDGVKGAVILRLCIVSTILDGTFDALIFSVYFHGKASF